MAKVILEHVTKAFAGEKGREVVAVDDASLTIEDKEFMVFVGPSGCGKSTTLRMIAGLEEITSGSIYIDGTRVNDVAPKDRDIAMVFQNYALYPHMTVYKNMAFGLQLRNYPKAEVEKRVREAAEILGLSQEMLERRPKALSGGQRQRVALGRAIVRKPKVFLFDEPLSNLDAKMRVQMRTEIAKLHHRLATTMIYVTHDQVEAMTMGDRICLMKDGRIQQVARPLEIYHRPANMFVAAFIGSPPMNFFKGMLIRKNGHLFFSGSENEEGAEGLMLQIADEQAAQLDGRVDKPIFLGIRPEDLMLRSPGEDAPSGRIFGATMELVESMGAETLVHFRTGPHGFIVRSRDVVREETARTIELVAAMERAHFFEAVDPGAYKKESGSVDLERWQAACRCIV